MIKTEDKIYIAGHTGLVGSALKRTLESEGYTNLIIATRDELNLLEQSSVEAFFAKHKPDVVFLAAGKLGGVYANNTYRAEFLYENITIESNIIHQSFAHEVRKLAYFGCSCMYPKDSPQPMKEEYLLTGPLEPTNEPFALAKLAGVKMCESYRRQYGCDFVSIIPTNIYGKNQNYAPLNSIVVPALIQRFFDAKEENAESVSIWGDGKQTRDFLFSDDLASACLHIMKNYSSAAPINVGSGKEHSILEVAEHIKKIVGFEGDILVDTNMPVGVQRKWQDITEITHLGWSPKTDLKSGLEIACQDFLDQRNKSTGS